MPGPGVTGAGMAGAGMHNRLVHAQAELDQGAQISHYVAGLGAISGAGAPGARRGVGAAVGRPVGVSTLVIGDMAFIGIHTDTLQTGTAGGSPGTSPGTSATGDPRGSAGPGLEGYLRQNVLNEFPYLSQVFVTSTPSLVARIDRVTGDNRAMAGNERLGEMFDIARTLAGPRGGASR